MIHIILNLLAFILTVPIDFTQRNKKDHKRKFLSADDCVNQFSTNTSIKLKQQESSPNLH